MPGPIDVQALLAALKGRPGGIASGGRTNPMEAIQQRASGMLAERGAVPKDLGGGPDMADLQGLPDPRGMTGILARGANVYPGGGPAQQGGGQQFGAPVGGGMPGMEGMPGMNPAQMGPAILRRIQAQRGNHGILA